MPKREENFSCIEPNTPVAPPLCTCNGGGLNLRLFRPPDAGHVGHTITYTVILSNPSTNTSCPITNITASITLPNGTTVTLPAPTTLAATAQASGVVQDCFCNSPTSATSAVCIFVAQPDFTLTKTVAPAVSKAGDSVQYTFTICNTGNIALNRIMVMDDMLGDLTAAFPATLAPGQCATVSHPFVVPVGATSPLVNTVTVHDHPEGFPNDVTASDNHSVTLANASCTLSKICQSGMVTAGGTAVFRVTVTNTGNVPLNFMTSESAPFSLAPGGVNTITKSATATCAVITFGRTRGFWGNQGHSILDPDNNGILNTLVAQTLALQHNILFILCFAGQTIGQLGCTTSITPQQLAGTMNSLLGCLNREA